MGQAKLRGTPEQRTLAAKEKILTPVEMLNAISGANTGLWKFIEAGALPPIRQKEDDDAQVFLHYDMWAMILLKLRYPNHWQQLYSKQQAANFPYQKVPDYVAIADIGTWRYTKGIYHLNDEIAEHLVNSDFKGNIPLDKISKLPEWSIYVDCSNVDIRLLGLDKPIVGFWASINCLKLTNRVLHFTALLADTFMSDITTCISLNSGIESTIEDDTDYLKTLLKHNGTKEQFDSLNKFKKQALQIILFICQSEPDVFENNIEVEKLDFCPTPQRIKGELRLFEAKHIRHFEVGVKAGRVIRNALNAYHDSGKTQAPHIRRAHWHGYWKGSKKNDAQEFFYKWVAPVIVNGDLVPTD